MVLMSIWTLTTARGKYAHLVDVNRPARALCGVKKQESWHIPPAKLPLCDKCQVIRELADLIQPRDQKPTKKNGPGGKSEAAKAEKNNP